MRRKNFTTALTASACAGCALGVAVLVLAGCGGGDGGGGTSRPAKPSASSGSKPATGGGDSAAADDGTDWESLEGFGNLTGTILYDGTPPDPAALQITKDADYCGKFNLTDNTLVVGKDGGLANVVVYLRDKTDKIHESYQEKSEVEIKLANDQCRFVPHVVPIALSQTLLVTNPDPIAHNTNIQPLGDEGANPLLPADGEFKHKFNRQQNIPVPVSCNIHPWMKGYVLPRETPYMAVTDENGKFTIENLPAGKWEFQVWHERSGYLETGDWDRGRFEIGIKPDETADVGEVSVAADVFNK